MNSMQRLMVICLAMLMGTPENYAMKEDKKYSLKEVKIPAEPQRSSPLYKDGSKLSPAKGRISPTDEDELSERIVKFMMKEVPTRIPFSRDYEKKVFQGAANSLSRAFLTATNTKLSRDMARLVSKYTVPTFMPELTGILEGTLHPIIKCQMVRAYIIHKVLTDGWNEELRIDFKAYIKANKEMKLAPLASHFLCRKHLNFSDEDSEEEDSETVKRCEEALRMCSELPEYKMWVERSNEVLNEEGEHEKIGEIPICRKEDKRLFALRLCALNLGEKAPLFLGANPTEIQFNALKLSLDPLNPRLSTYALEDDRVNECRKHIEDALNRMYVNIIKHGDGELEIKKIALD